MGDYDDGMVSAEIKQAFQDADMDGNGYIDYEELSRVFQGLGEWSEEELQEMWGQVDTGNDGKVSYNEFVDWAMAQEEEEFGDQYNDGDPAAVEPEECYAEEGDPEVQWGEPAEGEPQEGTPEAAGSEAAGSEAWDYMLEEAESEHDWIGDDYEYESEMDEEEIEYWDNMQEAADLGIDYETPIKRDAFKVIALNFEYRADEADETYDQLAKDAEIYETGSAEDGIQVTDVMWHLEIEDTNAEMMQLFAEALSQARLVESGEQEMPAEHEPDPPPEALEGEEIDNPMAAASALDRIAAYINAHDVPMEDVPSLLEENKVSLTNSEQAAIGQISNLQERLEQIIAKPPALSSSAGMLACHNGCCAAVEKIIEQYKAEGTKYSDPDFDVINDPNKVLWVDKEAPGYDCTVSQPAGWKRLTELVEAPVLFKDDAKACDIIQGSIGTCFLLGAMGAMVSNSAKQFKSLFMRYDVEAGVYGIRFSVQGEWKHVIIDDYMPVTEYDELLYAKSKDPQEIWVPLLEKAYCKLYTCYEMCDGGWSRDAINSFYGGINGQLAITDEHREDPSKYFKVLKNARKKGYLLCTGFESSGAEGSGSGKCGEDMLPCGLVGGHAYSVLRLVEAEGNQLVCCRNPWGSGEWTGTWSDANENGEWTDSMKKACGFTEEEDGIFWMSIEDFVKNATNCEYARCFGPKWKKVTMYRNFQKTSMKARAKEEHAADVDDEISFAKDEIVEVTDMSGYWFIGKKKGGEKGFFPGEKVSLLKRPVSRFDLTIAPSGEDKVKAVIMVMQPNAHFKRKFYKMRENGMNYKDTSYQNITLIVVGADGQKVLKTSGNERLLWGELKIPNGEAFKCQVYAMSQSGSGERFAVRVECRGAVPELRDSPGATINDLKGILAGD